MTKTLSPKPTHPIARTSLGSSMATRDMSACLSGPLGDPQRTGYVREAFHGLYKDADAESDKKDAIEEGAEKGRPLPPVCEVARWGLRALRDLESAEPGVRLDAGGTQRTTTATRATRKPTKSLSCQTLVLGKQGQPSLVSLRSERHLLPGPKNACRSRLDS